MAPVACLCYEDFYFFCPKHVARQNNVFSRNLDSDGQISVVLHAEILSVYAGNDRRFRHVSGQSVGLTEMADLSCPIFYHIVD